MFGELVEIFGPSPAFPFFLRLTSVLSGQKIPPLCYFTEEPWRVNASIMKTTRTKRFSLWNHNRHLLLLVLDDDDDDVKHPPGEPGMYENKWVKYESAPEWRIQQPWGIVWRFHSHPELNCLLTMSSLVFVFGAGTSPSGRALNSSIWSLNASLIGATAHNKDRMVTSPGRALEPECSDVLQAVM